MEMRKPLSTLRRLAREEASGELISANDDLEIHVYLQRGRLAWAIDSGKPYAFTRRLLELTDLDRESFREIVTECRQRKLPLGETLVAWKVATRDQVREALRDQLAGSLASLLGQGETQVIFLERSAQYAEYDAALTFDLEEALTAARSALGADQGEAARAGGQVAARDDAGLARRVREGVPGVLWARVLGGASREGDRGARGAAHLSPEASSPAPSTDVIEALAETTLADGADMVVVRTGLGTILGTSLREPNASLWCGLGLDVTVGAAISKLMALIYLEDRVSSELQRRRSSLHEGAVGAGVDDRIERGGGGTSDALVQSLMAQASEVLGAVILGPEGEPTYWAVREGADRRALLGRCVRRRAVLTQVELLHGFWPAHGSRELEGAVKTMVTGEEEMWCFGAEVGGALASTLWLALPRSASQGRGWAYISSLARQLARSKEAA